MDRGQLGLARQIPIRHRDLGHPSPSGWSLRSRDLLKPAFPSLAEDVGTTSVEFDIEIDSHGVREGRARGVPHLGEGLFGRPRAEIRITDLGTSSPLLDPEYTGALAVFVFRPAPGMDSPKCRTWICRDQVETDVVDDVIGPVEPGLPVPWGSA